jgi:hypothetical protein
MMAQTGYQCNVNLGCSNDASGNYNAFGGGQHNVIVGSSNTIGGGWGNKILRPQGGGTVAPQSATIGGGQFNHANGFVSTVPGGYGNIAAANYSFAAGTVAVVKREHTGAFVWADGYFTPQYEVPRFYSQAPHEFAARATGGVRFVTAVRLTSEDGQNVSIPTAGVTLAAGDGSWQSLSDENAKENFAATNSRAVLEKVVAIPIQTWNYKTQNDNIRHIGPTGQDFYAAFGVGADKTRITNVDADGVALAAIQGLYELVQAQQAAIEELKAENSNIRTHLQRLQAAPMQAAVMW